MLLKGTTTGTVTDIDGKFSLPAEPSDVLVISFVGYLSEEVVVKDRSPITVKMTPDIQSLQEVVVIGYGTAEKSDLTGAVGIVDAEELDRFPVTDVKQAMQGRLSGVQMSTGSAPGARTRIAIRGVSSIRGDIEPLYVVDGV